MLFRVEHAAALWRDLLHNHSVLIRDFSRAPGLEDCLRVTVGRERRTSASSRRCATCSRPGEHRRSWPMARSAVIGRGVGVADGPRQHRSTATTNETDIKLSTGPRRQRVASRSSTGVPFFDHMLDALGRHGLVRPRRARPRATSRSMRTTPSRTSASALARPSPRRWERRRGIRRFGSAAVPMDEALRARGRRYLRPRRARLRDRSADRVHRELSTRRLPRSS